ncbi:hypothetical protein KY319_02800 [Candidatus Woesearchaeota archaeon]|nr:hypothetical protein [Candidatus Woesearchaeota archaeon]
MKKLVILTVFLVLVAGGIWFLFSRPALPVSENEAEQAARFCSEDVSDLNFLFESFQNSDINGCYNIKYDVLKGYCLAFFGQDSCSKLSSDFQKSCYAVLKNNPSECSDEMCNAVLGDVAACTSSLFISVANRDSSVLADPSLCEENVEMAVKNVECTQKSKSIEEMYDCMNS